MQPVAMFEGQDQFARDVIVWTQAWIIASGGGSIQQAAHMGSASVWLSGRPQRSQTGAPMGARPL